MSLNKDFVLSLVAPFMVLRSVIGLMLREKAKRIFYLPMGLMGISIILEKDLRRKLYRKKIFKKIKFYQKVKQE